MELYILDSTFKETMLIESYETAIWTERFRSPGDVEITTLSTPENKSLLRVGTYLGTDLSPRIMEIDTVKDSISDDGIKMLKITGTSLERILDFRTTRQYFNILDDDEVWLFNDKKPTAILREVFNKVCIDGVLSVNDKIPYIQNWPTGITPLYKHSDIPEPTQNISIELPVQTISKTFEDFLTSYLTLGYRLYRRPGFPSELYFDVYTGCDRTLMQKFNTPVVFSLPWGTLDSYSELDSIAEYANVAYVFSKYGSVKVNDSLYTGFNRRVLTLVVNDQLSDNLRAGPLTAYLTQKGLEALAEAKRTALVEGEIPQNVGYTYMKDYNLGDYVDLLGTGDSGAQMTIVENIFVSDKEGFRSYPTFEMDEHIDPDTWSGLRGGEVWSTMPGYWETYSS